MSSLAIFALFAIGGRAQGLGSDISQGFRDGTFNLDFRYRYEFVSEDGFDEDANASTLWTRILYTSAPIRGFSVALNLDDLHGIGVRDYNSTRNGKTEFPLVPDPTGAELNLATVSYSGWERTAIVVGRQRIKRANDRFVSNVPWRQNETTYDAVSLTFDVSDRLELFYSYADQVNRAFGPDSGVPAATLGGPVNLLDVTFTPSPQFRVTAYGYWLDFDDAPEAPALSTKTLGVRATGEQAIGENWSLTYVGEYARQSDHGSNPVSVEADYVVLEVGVASELFDIRGGYELLGGSGIPGEALQTPLGLVHNFQGWADKFLVTPPSGIEDFYLAGGAELFGGNFTLAYHDFAADSGGISYGDELDFSVSWGFADRYTLWGGFAVYRAEGFATDTEKIWVMLSASF